MWYKVGCDCGGDDCGTEIEFEIDKDFSYINVNFYKKVIWADHWGYDRFYERWWARIKASFKILFTGYIDMEGNFMIQDIDHLDAFIEALEEGKQKMLKLRKITEQ